MTSNWASWVSLWKEIPKHFFSWYHGIRISWKFWENSGPFEDYRCPSHSKKGGWSVVVFIWCIFLEGLGVWFGSLVVLCSDNFLVLRSFSFSSFNLYRKDTPSFFVIPGLFAVFFPNPKYWKNEKRICMFSYLVVINWFQLESWSCYQYCNINCTVLL